MPPESLDQALENVQLREQLEATQKSLQDFVYVVSHDLGAPLRALTGFSSILKNKYADRLDEKGQTYLDFVSESSGKVQQMLGGLLQYSRVYTQVAPSAPVDLSAIAGRAINLLKDKIVSTEAKVSFDDLPYAFADPYQIEMLFQIVIDNALTYRQATMPPHIEITAQETESHWKILIADNGIGIAKENADRVFQLFKRLNGEEAYPGVGMGLPIARRIVERHGGAIGMTPGRMRGSVCWFTLPKSVEETADLEGWREMSHG